MKDSLNIGLLGYGGIGRIHALCYNQIPYYYPGDIPRPRVHSVCTSREESAVRARRETEASVAETDLHRFVADPELDVVDITLPNHLHLNGIEAALMAGKHIYCEKPLAGTIEDARKIVALAEQYDSRVGMVFQFRFMPALLRAHQLITEGYLGRIYTFRAEFLHSGYQDPSRPLSWRLKRAEGGTGALGDLGSHVIDLVRHLLGEYQDVQGHLETFVKERPVSKGAEERGAVEVDDVAWLNARMKSGAVGSIEVSRFATGTLEDLRLWIHGHKGALKFHLMEPGYLDYFNAELPRGDYGGSSGWQRLEAIQSYPGAVAPPPRSPIGWDRAHGENQYRFLKAIHHGEMIEDSPILPGVVDGLKVQLAMDAVEKSSASGGGWVQVEEE